MKMLLEADVFLSGKYSKRVEVCSGRKFDLEKSAATSRDVVKDMILQEVKMWLMASCS